MLIDKYLPSFHYREKHSISIASDPETISARLENLDFGRSAIIRFLFWLRGMPSKMLSVKGITNGGFIELEREFNKEIVIGLAGQFWKPKGNLQTFAPAEFVGFNKPDFLKGVWSFNIEQRGVEDCVLSTETRVYCTSELSRKRFSRYWIFVKPFSGLIRMEILRAIKKSAEEPFLSIKTPGVHS
jgi:hypothetical protein